jgi:tetratricopeptide (TPR) repeat protein
MSNGGSGMRRSGGIILALTTAFLVACAGGGAAPGAAAPGGERPRDDTHTRAAGVQLAQATLRGGDQALEHFQEAHASALAAIERDPNNPKAYLLAGQAAVGLGDFVQADTMFDRAQALYPRYEGEIDAEREEAWIAAYNRGAEALNAGNVQSALEYFQGADRLYQGRAEARMALGMLHSSRQDTQQAMEAYRGALEILEGPPPADLPEEEAASWARDRQNATFGLAELLAQTGRYGEAADLLGEFLDDPTADLGDIRTQVMTARATYVAQAGRTEEAERLYEELLRQPGLGADDYFQIGIGFFNASDYHQSAAMFARSAEMNPHSRDAHLNVVQSLYSAAMDLEQEPATPQRDEQLREMYTRLIDSAERVREFDPLNRNLLSFVLRAYRGQADLAPAAQAERLRQQTQQVFRQYESMEYEVSDLSLAIAGENRDRAEVEGSLTNVSGAQGQQVGLRFTVLDRNGQPLGSGTTQIAVPAQESSVRFSLTVPVRQGEFGGWRYELVR